MLLYIPEEKHQSLIFLDTEFNDRKLIQVAMIAYEKIDVKGVTAYLLKGSINLYIDNEINYFFTRYTNISQEFLNEHSIPQEEAVVALNEFLKDYKTSDSLYIAHGVKQDLDLIAAMGVSLGSAERYCTYSNSKILLKRDKELRLIDVCNESGYFADQHDAYTDAKNVVHAFTYLKLIETIAR